MPYVITVSCGRGYECDHRTVLVRCGANKVVARVVVNEYGGIFVKYKDCEDEEKGYLADIVASDDEFEVLGNIYENPNLLV